jgi:hypothetical protein
MTSQNTKGPLACDEQGQNFHDLSVEKVIHPAPAIKCPLTSEGNKPPHCLNMALLFANSGFAIFPVPPGTKRSYKSALYSGGANWGATRDPVQIAIDFNRWRNANIGLPTGNGLFVIDCDTIAGHGEDGVAAFAAFIAGGNIPRASGSKVVNLKSHAPLTS